MALTVSGPTGWIEIELNPFRLCIYRHGDTPALITAGPGAFARAYGLDFPLHGDSATSASEHATRNTQHATPIRNSPAPIALIADLPSRVTKHGVDVTPPVSLTCVATAGGFRLELAGPVGTQAVGLAFARESGAPWYGGGERIVQDWPLDRRPVESAPFISYDFAPDGTLNIATPLWFGAGAGGGAVGLLAESTGELDMSLDRGGDGLLRLVSRPPVGTAMPGIGSEPPHEGPHLTLDIFLADSIPAAFAAALLAMGHPARVPPAALFTQPIWTTWARYKMDIDQATTLAFAADIVANGFGRSVLEIDDRWQATYGELRFDPVKFPDPGAMVAELHRLGFAVTLWTPTFFSPDSPAFVEAAAHGYLVRHRTGAPYLVRWWQGYGGLLDVTNPAARDWWLLGLRRLQTAYGIDGYKFDAGEGNFLPLDGVTHTPIRRPDYSDIYAHFVGEHFPISEVRAGWRAQRTPILFRQWDKWSRWGLDNGLHACITQALVLSLAGYPFILPDMIGGNAYDGEVADRELLIRWTQMNALLPAMQFSLPPWEHDAETTAICRRYTELHAAFAPYLLDLAADAARSGTPIIRPLFWHYPADLACYTVDDSFLLGDRYLVAPVVQPGATSRTVYLPPGRWRDYWIGRVYDGGLLPEYPAPLDTLPLFERVEDRG